MSVAEIIEQIKALPEGDFRAVAEFVDEVRRGDGTAGDRQRQIRPDFHDAAREVFDRHDDLFHELAK